MFELSAPRRLREARKRGAERTVFVREHRRLPMNAIFEAEYASLNIQRDQSLIIKHPLNFRLSAPRRSHEASDAKRGAYVFGTRALQLAMNAIFEAEYATLDYNVIKV